MTLYDGIILIGTFLGFVAGCYVLGRRIDYLLDAWMEL